MKKRKRKLNPNFKFTTLFILTIALLIASSIPSKNKTRVEQFLNKNITASTSTVTPIYIVCLDAGHGGEDVGANTDERTEKDDCLKLTLAIGKYLEKKSNIQVVYTRTDDTFIEVDDRPTIANNCNADVFLSIHRNFYEGDQEVKGFEAWIESTEKQEDIDFASCLLDSIETALPESTNRGVRSGTIDGYGEYAVNSQSNMPSCILEMSFLTSNLDNSFVDQRTNELAKAISEAITNYLTTHQSNNIT